MIQQFPDTLPSTGCQALLRLVQAWVEESQKASRGWRPLTYLFEHNWPADARTAVQQALQACIRRLSAEPGLDAETLYTETVALTVLGPGDDIPVHADNCRLDEVGNWVPSEYRQRCLSAVLYLNEDFDGGEIVFEQQALAIKPREGLLVVFPSDQRYTHRVAMIASGRRYALAMWFTVHRWHALIREPIPFRRPAD